MNNPEIKFISSQKMDTSEMKEQVINLGKALVKELGLERTTNTLSRWLAHYISEQIATLNNSSGDEKLKAENRCFEAILTLWKHREHFPDESRPFVNFESIFRVLESLDLENKFMHYLKNFDKTIVIDRKVKNWVDRASTIDRLSRHLISYSIGQATQNATDEKTRNWLGSIKKFSDKDHLFTQISGDDLTIIRKLISQTETDLTINDFEKIREIKNKSMNLKLTEINSYLKIVKQIRKELIKEIKDLE